MGRAENSDAAYLVALFGEVTEVVRCGTLYFQSPVEILGWYNGRKSTPWSATNNTASRMYLACSERKHKRNRKGGVDLNSYRKMCQQTRPMLREDSDEIGAFSGRLISVKTFHPMGGPAIAREGIQRTGAASYIPN